MAKPKWSHNKRQIKDWEPRELVGLVKDLFYTSLENRRFLAARFLQDVLGPELLEPFHERIHTAFYARNGWPQERLELAEARRAIREYQRATGDVERTVELLLNYGENSPSGVFRLLPRRRSARATSPNIRARWSSR